MKVLIVHNRYQNPGGEDQVVENEITLIKKNGIEVDSFIVTNDRISSLRDRIETAWDSTYSEGSKTALSKKIRDFEPTVVHVHNWFPLLSPSIYDACQEAGVPVVQTLHNFRMFCANGLLLRKNKTCESCLNGSPYSAVLHKCYRGSRLGSAIVAKMIARHEAKGTFKEKVDSYIALSEFSRDKFLEYGIDKSRIFVKPNFVPTSSNKEIPQNLRAVYVGRMSPEKGVRNLVEAWKEMDFPLHLIGEGPLTKELAKNAPKNVFFRGWLSPERVQEEISLSSLVVIPSICYENFPLLIAESFSAGRPVFCSKIGSLRNLVTEGYNGHFFEPASPSSITNALKVHSSPEHLKELGNNALRSYKELYTPEANFAVLKDIYYRTTGMVK